MSAARKDVTAATHPLLAERWSPRAFSAREIEPFLLRQLFEAARWAPSSSNQQPWRFIYGHCSQLEIFDRLLSCLNDSNQVWARRAAVLALGVTHTLNPRNGRPNGYARYDLGQAVAHLTVQAMALGIHVHQMGGFSADKARSTFNIPEDFDPTVALALGYADDPATLPDDLHQREIKPRERIALSDIAFNGDWGKPGLS